MDVLLALSSGSARVPGTRVLAGGLTGWASSTLFGPLYRQNLGGLALCAAGVTCARVQRTRQPAVWH